MKSNIFKYLIIFLAICSIATECNEETGGPDVDFYEYTVDFTVTPETGPANSTFNFEITTAFCFRGDDAEPITGFQWDFNYEYTGQNEWDTDVISEKTITHEYITPGTYVVVLKAIVDEEDGKYDDNTNKLVVVTDHSNTPPQPLFTISPEVGYVHYIYDFNATSTLDNEDPQESLMLRWDYETDYVIDVDWGAWDTTAITFHIYDTPGEYTATLYAKDTEGLVDSIKTTVSVIDYLYDVPCPDVATVSYKGKTFNTVYIVDQCWLKESLNVGVKLDYGANSSNNGQVEKFCFKNLEANCDQYGGIYQWDEMMDYVTTEGTQGICPDDWHIPTFDDISKLRTNLNYIGTFINPSLNETNIGKQAQHPLNNCLGSCQDLGQSGFDFLLGGTSPDPNAPNEVESSAFWTSKENSATNAKMVVLDYDYPLWTVPPPGTPNKHRTTYVRCIRNE